MEEYIAIIRKDLDQIDSSFNERKIQDIEGKLKKMKIQSIQNELSDNMNKVSDWKNKLIEIKTEKKIL